MRASRIIHPRVKKALNRIGVPESTKFTPDPFQLEAVQKINDGDVIVTAPTGSGKTWIATSCITQLLKKKKRIWYAAPLKALSNVLYTEFCSLYGADTVGILTGDRKENSDAPVIVGTTEILRNHLYDAMSRGEDLPVDLVVLDEAHYLGDPDRGMVWEEVMIYLPPRIRLLLLSATIANSKEIADWIENNRDVPCSVVESFTRPVPLFPLFMFPWGYVAPLKDNRGLFPEVEQFEEDKAGRRRRFGREGVNFGQIINRLRELDLLPAIFFLKSRADCNNALLTCRIGAIREREPGNTLEDTLEELLKAYPFLKNHPQLFTLRKYRVAAHHAGQLPYWKLLVEQLMKAGRLDAIFSTSTVAAGVNFPARTVIITQSDRFNGREFVDLTATELHQMLGRAGRRGMDHIGFAVVHPGPYQNPKLICGLLDSPPDPVRSGMRVSFSMTLNLLLSHTQQEVKHLFERSFATFQGAPEIKILEKELKKIKKQIQPHMITSLCPDANTLIDTTISRQELDSSIQKVNGKLQRDRKLFFMLSHIKRGRLFFVASGKQYCALESLHPELKRVRAVQVKNRIRVRKGRIKFKTFYYDRIIAILDKIIHFPDDATPEQIAAEIQRVSRKQYRELSPKSGLDKEFKEHIDSLVKKRNELSQRRKTLPCAHCDNAVKCFGKEARKSVRVLQDGVRLRRAISGFRDRLWKDFLRHFEFIAQEGYVGPDGALTRDGTWAARLRLDQPLLVAECIRQNAFPSESPQILAGLMALFVAEKPGAADVTVQIYPKEQGLTAACARVMEAIEPLRIRKKRAGFDNPPMPLWAALALFRWASGWEWNRMLETTELDEGDLAMLIYRTADHLRQLVGLGETHPFLSKAAEEGVKIIHRDPVAPF